MQSSCLVVMSISYVYECTMLYFASKHFKSTHWSMEAMHSVNESETHAAAVGEVDVLRELLVPPAAERLPEVSVQRAAERPDTGEHEVVLNLVVAQVRVRVDERLEVKRNTSGLTMIKLFSP